MNMKAKASVPGTPSKDEFLKGISIFKAHEKRDSMYKVATFLVSHYWGKPADMADGLGVLLLTWNQAFYRYGSFSFDELEGCINRTFEIIQTYRNRDISTLSDSDEIDIRQLFTEFLMALQIDSVKFSEKTKKKYSSKRDLEVLLQAWGIAYDPTSLKTIYETVKDNPTVKESIAYIEEESDDGKEYLELTISNLPPREKNRLNSTTYVNRSPVSVAKALHLLAPNFFPLWDDKISKKYQCYYNVSPAQKYIEFCKITKKQVREINEYVNQTNRTPVKLIDEFNYCKYTKSWL
jgi:hypothetical protein